MKILIQPLNIISKMQGISPNSENNAAVCDYDSSSRANLYFSDAIYSDEDVLIRLESV